MAATVINIDSDILRNNAKVYGDCIPLLDSEIDGIKYLLSNLSVFGSSDQQAVIRMLLQTQEKILRELNDRFGNMQQTLYGFAGAFDTLAQKYGNSSKNTASAMREKTSYSTTNGQNLLVTFIPPQPSLPNINDLIGPRVGLANPDARYRILQTILNKR